jgi:mitotic spindle assembly checkpoint protein MAD2B
MAPNKTPSPTNYISLVAHFLDFLTVAIHTILYERNIYPRESFISARKYNYPVRQSRHPDLCEWINDAINHLEKQLMLCSVEKVSLIIHSLWNDPLERFVFDLSRFPVLKRQDWYTEFAQDGISETDQLNVINIEEQFRAVMARLAYSHRDLEPLPEDCSFNIAIELRDDAEPPITHPQPWIPAVPSLQKETETNDHHAQTGSDLGGISTTPIRLVDAGPMVFEMWIEESRTKIESINQVHVRDIENYEDVHPSRSKATGNEKGQPQPASVEDDIDEEFSENLSQFSFMKDKD